MDAAFSPQSLLQAAMAAIPKVRVAETYVLAATRPPGTKLVRASEVYVLAAVASGTAGAFGPAIPRYTQLVVHVMYSTGVGAAARFRAWTFDLDGHTFYVLDLGEEGTWVYDMLSKQWSKFETDGYGGTWNAKLGVYWSAAQRTIVSDGLNPNTYFIEPATTLDEGWRPITYVVTGGVEVHNRLSLRQYSFRLTASSGDVADPDVDAVVTMSLRFSDDRGNTWTATDPLTLEPGNFEQELAWRSLGAVRAPGRIFEIEDRGGLVKIQSADAEIEGLDDGSQG